MPIAPVIGSSPVNILSADGKQTGIPLTLLTIKDGTIDTGRLDEPLATDVKPVLTALLASGALAASQVTPPPVVALKLRAKAAGKAGNTISVKFSDVDAKTPLGDSTATVAIHYEDRRPGLTAATIAAELAARPALVALKAGPTTAPATMLTPTPLAGSPLELAIPAETGSNPAFTLQAVGTDPLLDDLRISIVDVAVANSFTLVITLDHSETALELGDIDSTFSLLVDVVSGPAAAPAEGVIKLTGGSETETAKPAEASVLSD